MFKRAIDDEWAGIGQAVSRDHEEVEERNIHVSSRGQGPPT